MTSALLFVAHISVMVSTSSAETFRYRHYETTGLTDHIVDSGGKVHTVVFTPRSSQEALAILRKLYHADVSGTLSTEFESGVRWEQKILVHGTFESSEKFTASGPGRPTSEPYFEFTLKKLEVSFPLSRWVYVPKGDPLDGPTILETHFSFKSIFPDGVKFEGKKVALEKYEIR